MLPMIEDAATDDDGDGDEVNNENMPTSNFAAPIQNLWDLAKRNKRPAITMGERASSGFVRSSGARSVADLANNQIATIQRF